jgi:hypothetical protein
LFPLPSAWSKRMPKSARLTSLVSSSPTRRGASRSAQRFQQDERFHVEQV